MAENTMYSDVTGHSAVAGSGTASGPYGRTIRKWATAPATRFWVCVAFIAIAALTGGGSRADIQSLVILRPAAFLMAGYALSIVRWDQIRSLGASFWIVFALAVLMVLQLVPLPADVWAALPGRSPAAQIDAAAGLTGNWRPLTLSPSGTLNSLFSLIVPIAALLLIAIQDRHWRSRLLWAVLGVAGATALMSILQAIGPARGPFYFYRITNFGSPVGLFANRNHNAILLAATIPLLGYLTVHGAILRQRASLWLPMAAVLFLVPLILVIGSRAGAVLALVAVISTAALCSLNIRALGEKRSSMPLWVRWVAVGGGLVAIGVVSAVTWTMSRSRAIERLFSEPFEEEFRVRVFGYLRELAEIYYPAGSGFGTFEHVYYAIEPTQLLRPRYLNHAHNDALQFVIEGGLPAVVLALIALVWIAVCAIRLVRAGNLSSQSDGARSRCLAGFAILSLTIVLAGGIADYPLRTPLVMVFAAIIAYLISAGAGRPHTRK